MGCAVFGMLFVDFNFILVAKFAKYLPGHYYFLIFGPFIEGLLGGKFFFRNAPVVNKC